MGSSVERRRARRRARWSTMAAASTPGVGCRSASHARAATSRPRRPEQRHHADRQGADQHERARGRPNPGREPSCRRRWAWPRRSPARPRCCWSRFARGGRAGASPLRPGPAGATAVGGPGGRLRGSDRRPAAWSAPAWPVAVGAGVAAGCGAGDDRRAATLSIRAGGRRRGVAVVAAGGGAVAPATLTVPASRLGCGPRRDAASTVMSQVAGRQGQSCRARCRRWRSRTRGSWPSAGRRR